MENQRTIKLYRAKLHTGGKTPEQIKSSFNGPFDGPEPSNEEIQVWSKAYDLADGLEVIVKKSWTGNDYSLIAWDDTDDEKIREFIYQVEQDGMFGTYVDEREEFIKDWESGEYCPAGSLLFNEKDVEIIEELKQKQ
ncbi:hypothetical protein ACH0BF_20295 [Pseudobacillus sp. 179-B 2D1 NHS]|uniref:hypothetical protein n=1 Tax=Pseudobacillus sp. 179-B 2D1 NHS TaxID=3374292 RepID=UPI0038798829